MIRNTIALTVLSMAAFAAEAPLLSFVDPGAKVIAGVQADRALASPLGRYLLAQINQDDPEFLRFIEETGFDPRRDVREIVIAGIDHQRKHGLIVARGVFNGPRIVSTAGTHGALITSYNGVQVAATKSGQWLAILDGSLALAGEEALVKYAIDRPRNETAVPSFALAQKAASLAARFDVWFTGAGAIVPPAFGRRGATPMAGAFEGIRETSGGVELGAVVRFSAEALTRSEKDAQALVDVIRFMATMIRNGSASNPDAQRIETILNSLEVGAEAATVRLSVAVAEADLEQWVKPKQRTRQRAAR
jgi:hypothetical protein